MSKSPRNGHDAALSATRLNIETREGKVIWQFSRPTQNLALEPQNAFEIAEATARAAHHVRFPGEKIPDGNYIAQQVRARLTDALHDKMVIRVKSMLPKLIRKEKDLDFIAREVVDQIFSEVDR